MIFNLTEGEYQQFCIMAAPSKPGGCKGKLVMASAGRYASIDIGTNTLRLLIVEIGAGGFLTPIHCERVITRLGGGYSEEKGISPASVKRTLDTLKEFSNLVKEYGVGDVYAAATSVVRRAVNRDEFIRAIKETAGFETNVISGDEEARLSMLGVLSVIRGGEARRLIMDIGGGSTEFVAMDNGDMVGAWSIELGVVHLAERYIKGDPPEERELSDMEGNIRNMLDRLKRRISIDGLDPLLYSGQGGAGFIGTAGTVTTLAALDQGLQDYDPKKINNYILKRGDIKGHYNHLASLKLEERRNMAALEDGREDIIIAGASIALESMKAFNFESMTVSDSGLLEGILIDRLRGDCPTGG
ncbi:MAG: Ppx/GppA phosphatase family protein [Thermodesulfobacteriota bacterium]